MNKYFLSLIFLFSLFAAQGNYILIPMDHESQTDHLKAYGVAYKYLENGGEVYWLLNYRGGSFAFRHVQQFERECRIRNVSYQVITNGEFERIRRMIDDPEINMDVMKLETAPKIAVYSPEFDQKGERIQPWDDAVTLALTYAEIPYDIIYDREVMEDKLVEYDWLHLHHEDFTGQYGKFYGSYRNARWYIENKRDMEAMAASLGFQKVSQLKLAVVLRIREFVGAGGFMFAMCSATDTYDIALAAQNTDICDVMFDGDPMDPLAQEKLDFSQTFAFHNFTLVTNPMEYEYSSIDHNTRRVDAQEDYFTLFDFSAKWDPVPTMLTQNHTRVLKGFMGQTTAFEKKYIKPNVLIMGDNKSVDEARYIHGEYGMGFWTFFSGHDPEDYRHYVGDPQTDLSLHPNSPGYRLILNNILFPAARKKKHKT